MHLIINADDYGLSKKTSEGILFLAEKAAISSTSVIINSLTSFEINKLITLVNYKKIGIGLHIVLSPGFKPLTSSKFTNNGSEFPFVVDPDTRMEQISFEIKSQICLFVKYFKIIPDHINCHHNLVFKNPIMMKAFINTIRDYNLDFLVRQPFSIKEGEKHNLGKTLNELLTSYEVKLRYPKTIRGFSNKVSTISQYKDLLYKESSDLLEVMCHPGFYDKNLRSSYVMERQIELDFLFAVKELNFYEYNSIKLISFDKAKKHIS